MENLGLEISDVDENDPELLGELHKLMHGTAATDEKKSHKSQNLTASVKQINGTSSNAEEIDLHEHEIPELINELRALGLKDDDTEAIKPVVVSKKATSETIVVEKKQSSASSIPAKPPTLIPKEVAAVKPQKPLPASVKTVPSTVPTSPTNLMIAQNLRDLLQKQIDICTRLAADYYKIGRREEALHFHKYKKQFVLDQSLITDDQPPSAGSYQRINVAYQGVKVNWEIPVDKLKLEIESISGIEPVSSLYVRIDSPFTANPIDTSTFKTLPYPQEFSIESTKTFQRYFEKKKLSLEFYQSRFLRSSLLVGKLSLPLIELLGKCVINGSYPIMDQSGRKPTGAYCSLAIKMRKPFMKPYETEDSSEQWVIMNDPSFFSCILANTSVNSLSPTPTPSTPPVIKQSAKPTAPEPSKQQISTEIPEEYEELVFEFNAYQTTSNNLLEHLMTTVGVSSPEYESYKAALSVLVLQVQTGSLTVERYTELLEQEVKVWKQFALKFRAAGRMEYAKKSLDRVKIIASEIQSAKEMTA